MKQVKIRCGNKVKETHDYLVSLGYEPFGPYEYITKAHTVYSWFGWDDGRICWDNKPEYFEEDSEDYEEVFLPEDCAVQAPPIGLRPKAIVDALRIKEILEAMARYAEDGQKIPQEWVDEFVVLNRGE